MPRNENLIIGEIQPVVQAHGVSKDGHGNQFEIVISGSEESVNIYRDELPLTLEIRNEPTLKPEDDGVADEEPEQGETLAPNRVLDVTIDLTEVVSEKPYYLYCEIDKDIGFQEEQDHGSFRDAVSANLTFEVSQGSVRFILREWENSHWRQRARRILGTNDKATISRDQMFTGLWKIVTVGLGAVNEYSVFGDFQVP